MAVCLLATCQNTCVGLYAIDIVSDRLNSRFLVSISAAIVIPLVFIAFNVNEVSMIARAVIEHMVGGNDAEAKSTEATVTAQDVATTSAKRTEGKRRYVFLSMVEYGFILFPLGELQFALSAAKPLSKKSDPSNTQAGTDTTQPVRDNTQARGNATRPANDTTKKDRVNKDTSNTIQEQQLELRPKIKYTVFVFFAIIRLLFLPLWLILLFIYSIIFVSLYSVAWLFFQDISKSDIMQRLRESRTGKKVEELRPKKDEGTTREKGKEVKKTEQRKEVKNTGQGEEVKKTEQRKDIKETEQKQASKNTKQGEEVKTEQGKAVKTTEQGTEATKTGQGTEVQKTQQGQPVNLKNNDSYV